jgi:hypothetical protein
MWRPVGHRASHRKEWVRGEDLQAFVPGFGWPLANLFLIEIDVELSRSAIFPRCAVSIGLNRVLYHVLLYHFLLCHFLGLIAFFDRLVDRIAEALSNPVKESFERISFPTAYRV